MMDLFKGVCPVMNTPFLENGDIDTDGIRRIIDYVIATGCQNIAIFALNSEPHKMTLKEKSDVIEIFLTYVGTRAHKLVGIVENSLRGAIELAGLAEQHGADGLVIYPPSLVPPANDQLIEYFRKICKSVDCPTMIQDSPRTTGVTMTAQFLINVFHEIENVSFVKVECPLPVHKIAQIGRESRNELKCLSGNGGIFTIDAFTRGAWGVMPGIGVVQHFVKMYNFFNNGEEATARDIFENLMPLLWFEDQSLEFFIACEKEILRHKGIIESSYSRVPRFSLDQATLKELHILLSRLKPA